MFLSLKNSDACNKISGISIIYILLVLKGIPLYLTDKKTNICHGSSYKT